MQDLSKGCNPGFSTGEVKPVEIFWPKRTFLPVGNLLEAKRAFPTKCENRQSLNSLTRFYPSEVDCTIACDGKSLGRLESSAPADFACYAEIGLEKIPSAGQIPTIGRQSKEYSGWYFAVYIARSSLSPNQISTTRTASQPPRQISESLQLQRPREERTKFVEVLKR
jgi:hypothetical protein